VFQRALHKASIDIPVWMIQVVGSSDELTSRLRAIVRTPSTAISGIRFSNNSIGNNNYVEDAYIYRSS